MTDPITLGIFAAALLVEAAVAAYLYRREMHDLRSLAAAQLEAERSRSDALRHAQHALYRDALDRLQARSLGEYKAYTEPQPEPAPAEAVDADWDEPSFARPNAPQETEE